MATYYFTSKTIDEQISTCEAKTMQEAIEIFSGIKQLEEQDFLKIYNVKRKTRKTKEA